MPPSSSAPRITALSPLKSHLVLPSSTADALKYHSITPPTANSSSKRNPTLRYTLRSDTPTSSVNDGTQIGGAPTHLSFLTANSLISLSSNGTVRNYDIHRGVLHRSFAPPRAVGDGPVLSMTASDRAIYLLQPVSPPSSTNKGGKSKSQKYYVLEYSPEGKLLRKIKCGRCDAGDASDAALAVSTEGDYMCVVLGNSVRVVRLEDGARVGKFELDGETVEGGDIVAWSGESMVVVRGAMISVFQLEGEKDKTKMKEVKKVRLAEKERGRLVGVDVRGDLLCLVFSEMALVYDWKEEGEMGSFAVENADKKSILSGFFEGEEDIRLVLTDLGTNASDLIVEVQKFGEGLTAIIGKEDDESIINEGKKRSAMDISPSKPTPPQPSIMGSGQTGNEQLTIAQLDTTNKKPKLITEDQQTDQQEQHMSIADRLQAMEKYMDNEYDDQQDNPKQLTDDDTPKSKPTASSLTTILVQSLQSNDDQTLDSTILTGLTDNSKVISQTVAALPRQYLKPLLESVILKLSKRPHRANLLCTWIREIIKVYTFASHDEIEDGDVDLVDMLGPLRNLVTERVEVFGDLLMLEGRLGMLNCVNGGNTM